MSRNKPSYAEIEKMAAANFDLVPGMLMIRRFEEDGLLPLNDQQLGYVRDMARLMYCDGYDRGWSASARTVSRLKRRMWEMKPGQQITLGKNEYRDAMILGAVLEMKSGGRREWRVKRWWQVLDRRLRNNHHADEDVCVFHSTLVEAALAQ